MPCGDGTGPMGQGPMTGRGWGRGRGGHGGGRGWRHWYYATGLPGWARAGRVDGRGRVADADVLREQAKYLEEALADVRKSLERMEAESKEE